MSNSNSPKKLGLPIFLGSIALIGVVVSAALMQNPGRLLNANGVYGDTSDYTVVLDSSNKYTSGTTKEVTTSSGQWSISFEYTNASALTNGHVTLADGGKLVNTREFISLDYLKIHCDGAGTLRFRTSYDGATWGGYATVSDNEIYNLASNPYYIELTATGGSVNIYQATYQYTCVPNEAAQGTEVSTDDKWVKVTSASDLSAGDEIVMAASYGSNWYTVQNETISGRSYWLQAEPITLTNSNTYASVTDANSVWTVGNGSTSGTYTFKSNGNYLEAYVSGTNTNLGLVSEYDDSACDWSLTFGSSTTDFYANSVYMKLKKYTSSSSTVYEFIGNSETDSYARYIYKRVAGESHTEYDIPVDEVGFTVSDANATGVYTTNSVYSSDNGLVAKAKFSDGSQTTLTSAQYTYTVSKTQGGSPIDASQAFGDAGTYYVSVSYKDYLPQIIQIHVSEPAAVLTHIVVNSSTLTFNTAQKLSDYTNGITVDLTYDKSSADQTGVAYSELSSYNLSFYLLTPAGVSYDVSTVFGTAGTWTLKVVSNADSSVFGTLEITVNAIPVETISLSASSTSIEEGSTVQLVTSVNPSTATNQELTWTSSDEGVATVNNSGLVTAVSVGEAIITATAQDGSNVAGSITITVTEKVTGQDEGTFTLSTGDLTIGSYVVITNAVSDGDAYAMSNTQNENNRPGVSITIENGTLERDSTSSFRAFLVKAGVENGTYAFYDEAADGYLYAASSSKNYLRTETTLSENSSFTVSGSEGKTITAQGSNSRNLLRYNAQSHLFSCYASGQAAPYIYEKAGDPVYPTALDVTGTQSIGVGETSQLSVSFTPSNATVKSVTYESSDDLVATVSKTGLVTGIKAGKTTITVTGHNGITDSIEITVSNIAVSSVSLNKSSTSLTVGGTETLTATINPSNATNKNVTWSTSDNSVATVDDGVVTAVGAGSADIIVTTEDGSKTASCAVTVTASSSGSEVTETFQFTSKSWEATPANWTSGQDGAGYSNSGVQVTANASGANGTSPESYTSVQSVVVTYCTNASKGAGSINVCVGSTSLSSEDSVTTSGGTSARTMTFTSDGSLDGKVKIEVECTTNSIYIIACTINAGTPVPTDPTSISINPSSAELAPGASKTLSVVYTPSGANQNKAVTWSSNNSKVSVDTSGKVTVASTATVGTTATITAKLTNLPSIIATATVTVVETAKADSTILIYMCGADLESENALATGDIQEILSVSNQPDDVNIVIETGGAKSWSSTYGISSSNLQRYHVANKKLVLDDSLTYASMGLTSTFQSFLEYGLNNYPAERTGIILWNHGGGMRGVCYDEKKSDDSLINSEVKSAVSGAMNNCGISGQKLEWIGYDACLMQVQDIADFNSAYFNYMIASEESEAGYGWDYDTWVDDLYAKKDTTVILKAIVDGFIADNGGASSSSGDQTLSYLNLSYMSAYKTAWENMATQLDSVLTSSNRSSFNSAITGKVKHYADSDYDYFCTFDAKDFVNKLVSNSSFSSFRIDSSYTTAVLNAHANLVAYNLAQKGAGESHGLCMYWCNSTQYSDMATYYTTSQTNFTNWRMLNYTYGYHTS